MILAVIGYGSKGIQYLIGSLLHFSPETIPLRARDDLSSPESSYLSRPLSPRTPFYQHCVPTGHVE
jgi:hypothetical protein